MANLVVTQPDEAQAKMQGWRQEMDDLELLGSTFQSALITCESLDAVADMGDEVVAPLFEKIVLTVKQTVEAFNGMADIVTEGINVAVEREQNTADAAAQIAAMRRG